MTKINRILYKDLERVMEMEKEAYENGDINPLDGWIYHPHSKSYHARFTYVYKQNDTIKGFICIRPFVNNDEVITFSKIYNYPINNMGNLVSEVYVLPKFRDQKIKEALYEFASNQMYALSTLYSEIDTSVTGADAFQTAAGFVEIGDMSLLNVDQVPAHWQLFEIKNTANKPMFE